MKSVQGLSKQKKRKHAYAKTDLRYWQEAVFRPTYGTEKGQLIKKTSLQYHVKIQHQGRREGFALQRNNKSSAAEKAKSIYLVGRSQTTPVS